MRFEIDEEEETELLLKGKLHRSGDNVGVEWIKEVGNDFWLSSIVARLNESLYVIGE